MTNANPQVDPQATPQIDPQPANPDTEPQPAAEPHGNDPAGDPIDWKATSRQWEERSKANLKKAEDLEESNATLQANLAEATKRAEAAEAKVTEMETAAARDRAVNAIAAETGVSAAILARMSGSTEDEIRANAEVVRATMPIYPTTREGGSGPAPTVTKESILKIENERERLKAIADHADLF